METVDGGFFAVRSRSGDPTTEDLHLRTSHPKRLNSGKSHQGQRGDRPSPSSLAAAANAAAAASSCLAETESHAVVRAGSVPAAAAAATAESSGGVRCSGRVLSHGWAFLCANGSVLAWEQGMVPAERRGAAVGADQNCLRFDFPIMIQELAAMDPLEVPVEAADLVALTQPWEACGGKREMLLVSPGGLARYWPDLHSPRRFTDVDARSAAPGQSVTRVAALGPAEFLCGLSKGGVLRIRPGVARPCLLTQTPASVLGLGFSTIKRMGSFLGKKALAGAAAAPATDDDLAASAAAPLATAAPVVALAAACPPRGSPAPTSFRVICLTTDALEVWSVAKERGGGGGGGGGSLEHLEVRQPLSSQIAQALGVRGGVRLVDVKVTGAPSCVPGAVVGSRDMQSSSSSSSHAANWGLDLVVLAEAGGGEAGSGAFSVHALRVSSEEASWIGSSVTAKLLSSHRLDVTSPNISAAAAGAPLSRPRATLVADNERAFSPRHVNGANAPGGDVLVHVFMTSFPPSTRTGAAPVAAAEGGGAAAHVWSACVKTGGAGGSGDEIVEWEKRGSVEVSRRNALVGGCIGGGGALLGCPGVVLLAAGGQAVWVAPLSDASGPAVDLDLDSSVISSDAAAEWRKALLDEGLKFFEDGEFMDTARVAVEALLSLAAGEVDRAVSEGLDEGIVQVGLEVLNGSWRPPAAFASPHQLLHLSLSDKARSHRALVRFLMDAGVWGAASVGRAAISEGGEKIAAAARLCELQDAISRDAVGAKAAGLLDDCIARSMQRREAAGDAAAAAAAAVPSARDRYFERTQGVLDALVELHFPRLDDEAPSSSIGGATLTPLLRTLLDPALAEGDRLPLLNHLSVVVAGFFEAALRHRAAERNLYRAGLRGKVWTSSVEARLVLYRQLQAYVETIDGIALQGAGSGRGASEITRRVIGRLSEMLLDGFKEEAEAHPAASDSVEWQGEYVLAKELCVEVVAACGREDLARSLAEKHHYLEGTVALCHAAELRKPGCENGHRLLRKKMGHPAEVQEGMDAYDETQEERLEREGFAHFVLDWHLRRGLKTALLDVGAAVPSLLCEFLADWREAELLWVFQIRLKDYTGAGQALTRGTPPANQQGGRCEAQRLWLSLAKLAFLAGEVSGGDEGEGGRDAGFAADPARGAEIQRRLELAEARDRLVKSRPPAEAAMDDDNPWTWEETLAEATHRLNSLSAEPEPEGEGGYEVEKAADIAFQGYRALVAGLPGKSYESADRLWREVVRLTLADPRVGAAIAKGAMPTAAEDDTEATDREMEAVWRRPTMLHLLLRAIQKDRRLRREVPWTGGGATDRARAAAEEVKIDLTDESLSAMVRQLMPAGADKNGATCEAWVSAIRKCPW